jgi:superfamily II DNA or RNA helicase
MSGITQPAIAHSRLTAGGPEGRDPKPPVLRPYQVAALQAIDRELARCRSTLLVLPTGTGKTTVFSVAAQRWVQSRSERVLVLADREELLSQAKKRLEMFGVDARIEQGARSAGAARVVVASVATMVRRLDRWMPDAFGLVIEDECQHSPAASRSKIREHFSIAKVLGVTATPKRADEKSLDDVYESTAYQLEIRTAIGDRWLVPVSARRVVVDAIKLGELKGKDDFVQADLAKVMEAERAVEGVVVPLLELSTDRPTIVFAASVLHAQMLADAICERRPGAAVVVHGKLEGDERRHRLAAYESGRSQYLVNVDIATEGYDHPPTSCVAMARPTKSWARYVQAAGRGLRPSPETGKRDCLILDFTGTAGKHSLCGPADVLGAPGEIADDVRAEIDRLLGTAQLEVSAVVAAAEENAAAQRQKHAAAAVVQWHAEKINPFVGRTDHVSLPSDRPQGWGGAPASESALAEIERLTTNHKGEVSLSRDKLPAGFSRADAWRLITVLKHRDRNDLCTYAQAKRLSGFIDTVTLRRRDAGRLMAAGAKLGWPDGVRSEVAAILAERAKERAA